MSVLQLPPRLSRLYLLQLHRIINTNTPPTSTYLNTYASELLLLPELPLPQGTFQDRLLLAEGRQFGFEFGFPVGGLFARPPDL
jgi:hypothetical protein